jgi:hypothetical protein
MSLQDPADSGYYYEQIHLTYVVRPLEYSDSISPRIFILLHNLNELFKC